MTLSDERQIIQVWDAFADSGFRYAHDSGEIDTLGLSNDDRRDQLPVRQDLLQNFLDGELDLTTFKQEMDSECTQYKLWGFSGFSGQMFFNMLVSSADPDDQPVLPSLLREVLVAPEDHEEAVEHISRLTEYVEQLRSRADNPRSAPSKGYILYFLSYFWQLQEPDRYPIYYKSIRRTLSDLAIWEPSGELADDYIEFWDLNEEIRTVLENHTDDDIHLWTIERMCLFWLSRDTITDTADSTVSDPLHEGSTERPEPRSLPDSYIPPIVSVLPDLAQNTEEMQEIANEMGRAVETLFEDRLMKCLRMLGYTIDQRGQGSGRNPDGIAIARRHSYAIIYDAKVRQDAIGSRPMTNGSSGITLMRRSDLFMITAFGTSILQSFQIHLILTNQTPSVG